MEKTRIIEKIISLAIILIASIFINFSALAKNNVKNISVDVLIRNNGSATITQQWQGTFNEGTEVEFLPEFV